MQKKLFASTALRLVNAGMRLGEAKKLAKAYHRAQSDIAIEIAEKANLLSEVKYYCYDCEREHVEYYVGELMIAMQ